jgi:hypothetical protein
MANLPFAASFDALAHIVEVIRMASDKPVFGELFPALCFCLNSRSWDPVTNRTIQYIPFEHFYVGWYPPEEIGDAILVDVLGKGVFVHSATLERLAGKQLILKTLEEPPSGNCGFKRQLLMAEPLVTGEKSQ